MFLFFACCYGALGVGLLLDVGCTSASLSGQSDLLMKNGNEMRITLENEKRSFTYETALSPRCTTCVPTTKMTQEMKTMRIA